VIISGGREFPPVQNVTIMIAIKTEWKTNVFGRDSITAIAPSGETLTVPYPEEANWDRAHEETAEALAIRLGWLENFALISGELPCGNFAHIVIPSPRR
jgi:hypothetical protein